MLFRRTWDRVLQTPLSGRSQLGRMICFRRTASMASQTTIQASCQARAARKSLRQQWPKREVHCFRDSSHATKICIRSIVVRRTTIEQTCLKMLIPERLRRICAGCTKARHVRQTRRKELRFSHAEANWSWHVDCIISLPVNEDCGPPDC